MISDMREIRYKPIGIVHSPFKKPIGTPIQPVGARSIKGTVEIAPEYTKGLKDLDKFSHIILIYHFHLSEGYTLLVKPFMDDKLKGVFATRAPRRPNNIGISVVKLIKIEGNILYIENVDIVDGTPLLDIKPYVPEFDLWKVDRIGWLSERVGKVYRTKADKTFEKE